MKLQELKRTKNTNKSSVTIRGVKPSKITENKLKKFIRFILSELDSSYKKQVVNKIPKKYIDGSFQDANYASVAISFTSDFTKRFKQRFSQKKIKKQIKQLYDKQAQLNREQFNNNVMDEMGVDLDAIMATDGLSSFQTAQELEALHYINGLIDDMLKRYQGDLVRELGQGTNLQKLHEVMKKQTEMKVKKGKDGLAGRNLIKDFNTALSHKRMAKLGVEKVKWRTVGDERTRCTHRKLNGKVYSLSEGITKKWMEENGVPDNCTCSKAVHTKKGWKNRETTESLFKEIDANGGSLIAGGSFNCRCYAEAIMEF